MTQTTQKIRDYTVLSTLGQNREGGRITHLAQAPDGSKVVIKEFQFLSGSKWDDYSAIAREIEILKNLDHPRIPKFLESFETDEGACLVQQYIEAPNLDQKRTFSIDQVEKIAKDLLEILCYLQSLSPPVLHRDIKPGNLLLDSENNLYLVDFGFSRIGLEDIAVSSMVRGTTGFMPPEQMLGLDLTKASDLYSVGATLVCLILGIPSGRMTQLMDIGENRLKFGDRLPSDIDPHFVRWLKRMTEPNPKSRYIDAKTALFDLLNFRGFTNGELIKADSSYFIYKYDSYDGTLINAKFKCRLSKFYEVYYDEIDNGLRLTILAGEQKVLLFRNFGVFGSQNNCQGFVADNYFYCEINSNGVFTRKQPLLISNFELDSLDTIDSRTKEAAKLILISEMLKIIYAIRSKSFFLAFQIKKSATKIIYSELQGLINIFVAIR